MIVKNRYNGRAMVDGSLCGEISVYLMAVCNKVTVARECVLKSVLNLPRIFLTSGRRNTHATYYQEKPIMEYSVVHAVLATNLATGVINM